MDGYESDVKDLLTARKVDKIIGYTSQFTIVMLSLCATAFFWRSGAVWLVPELISDSIKENSLTV